MIRKNYKLVGLDNSELELYPDKRYTFNSIGGFLEIVNDLTISSNSVILTNSNDERSANSHALRNLNILFNDALGKSPKTFISLNSLRPGLPGEILVSQGPGVQPVWKTFASVFPEDIYQIETADSIIIHGTTMISSNFVNNPYIISGQNIYLSDSTVLETIPFTIDSNWYSHTVRLTFVPLLLVQKSSSTTIIVVDVSYNLVYNKSTRFIIEDNIGNLRVVNAIPIKYGTTTDYSIDKVTLGWKTTDVNLYLADHIVKTSAIDSEDEYSNYVINDLNYCTKYNTYDIDVWGDVNTFSSSIPVTSSILQSCLGDGFGLLIDSNNVMKGFGSNAYGQLTFPTNKYKYVASGLKHSCAITVSGELVSFGDNTFGQVSNTPDGNKYVKVVCAKYATAAITEDNELFIWGDLMYDYADPTFSTLEVKDISFGDNFFIIQKTDNKLYGYGDDTYGQISKIPSNTTYLSFDCGKYHVAAINTYNTLEVWGSNANAQLTYDTNKTLNYKNVQCGDYYTIAVKTDGTLYAFGNDYSRCVSGCSTVQKYSKVCANFDNVLGFKNEVFNVNETYITRYVTNNKLSLIIDFKNKGTLLNGIYINLEKE